MSLMVHLCALRCSAWSALFPTTIQVLAKFLAPPGRLADLLSIAGDSSDGVVGAEGYGPVKAAKVRGANSLIFCFDGQRVGVDIPSITVAKGVFCSSTTVVLKWNYSRIFFPSGMFR